MNTPKSDYFWLEIEDNEQNTYFSTWDGGGNRVTGFGHLSVVRYGESEFLREPYEQAAAETLAKQFLAHPRVTAVSLCLVYQEVPGESEWKRSGPLTRWTCEGTGYKQEKDIFNE